MVFTYAISTKISCASPHISIIYGGKVHNNGIEQEYRNKTEHIIIFATNIYTILKECMRGWLQNSNIIGLATHYPFHHPFQNNVFGSDS